MALINNEMNDRLNELVGKCFAINRMLDRGFSLLQVRWKMLQTAHIIHYSLAHEFLGEKFADAIISYQAKRSNETILPNTPSGDREYENPVDFFKDILKEMLELQDMLYDAYEMSKEFDDYTTKKFVNKIIETLSDFTDMAQNLIDLAYKFGVDDRGMALFDANIDEYFED